MASATATKGEFRTTPSVPLIESSANDIRSDSALLKAEINTGGAETEYHFEYGTQPCSTTPDPCMSTPVPDEEIGKGAPW